MIHYYILPHTLKFLRPARTSRGVYTDRKVWYVILSSQPIAEENLQDLLYNTNCWGGNKIGIGEIAPLYDLSCEYDANFEEKIKESCAKCISPEGINVECIREYPSICFGLETAWLSFCSQDGITLFDTSFSQGIQPLRINGLIWMGNIDFMRQQMTDKINAGFKCIKLKIGAQDFNEEYNLLQEIRKQTSKDDIEIRVDANGAYDETQAMFVLNELHKIDIHSIEQPIKQGQALCMSELCKESPVSIALDEELIGINLPAEKMNLLKQIQPQFIVIKPTLHGGISGSLEWIQIARKLGIKYWLTSALESNVGLNAIAQLTATFNDTERWQGLGTGAIFEENIYIPKLELRGECLWFQ